MRPPTYTKIFGNLRLNCVTSNQGECDQSESNVLKAKEGAKEADIVFNDKSLYSPLSVWLVERQINLWFAFLLFLERSFWTLISAGGTTKKLVQVPIELVLRLGRAAVDGTYTYTANITEPSNRAAHKKLLTEIQCNNAHSTRIQIDPNVSITMSISDRTTWDMKSESRIQSCILGLRSKCWNRVLYYLSGKLAYVYLKSVGYGSLLLYLVWRVDIEATQMKWKFRLNSCVPLCFVLPILHWDKSTKARSFLTSPVIPEW